MARARCQAFRAVQTETDVRVSVGVASAVRRTGRRRVYRFRVALEVAQIQGLDRGGYAVLGALLRRETDRVSTLTTRQTTEEKNENTTYLSQQQQRIAVFELTRIGRRRRQRHGPVGRYVRTVRVAGLALVSVQILFRVLHQLLHLGHSSQHFFVAGLREVIAALQYLHGHHALHVDPGAVLDVAVRRLVADVTVLIFSFQRPTGTVDTFQRYKRVSSKPSAEKIGNEKGRSHCIHVVVHASVLHAGPYRSV